MQRREGVARNPFVRTRSSGRLRPQEFSKRSTCRLTTSPNLFIIFRFLGIVHMFPFFNFGCPIRARLPPRYRGSPCAAGRVSGLPASDDHAVVFCLPYYWARRDQRSEVPPTSLSSFIYSVPRRVIGSTLQDSSCPAKVPLVYGERIFHVCMSVFFLTAGTSSLRLRGPAGFFFTRTAFVESLCLFFFPDSPAIATGFRKTFSICLHTSSSSPEVSSRRGLRTPVRSFPCLEPAPSEF